MRLQYLAEGHPEEEEEIKPYVHSAILTFEDKSMFMFSPNGPA